MTIAVSASPPVPKAIIFAAVLFGAGSFLGPSLPTLLTQMQNQLGVSFASLGLMLSVMFTVGSLSLFVWGYFLDRRSEGSVLAGALIFLVLGVGVLIGTDVYGISVTGAAILGAGRKCLPFLGLFILVRLVHANMFGRWYLAMLAAGAIGSMLAPITILFLATNLGWQFGLALVVILIAVLCGIMGKYCLKPGTNGERAEPLNMYAGQPVVMLCLALVLVLTAMVTQMMLSSSAYLLAGLIEAPAESHNNKEWSVLIFAVRLFFGSLGLIAGAFFADYVRRPGLWVGGGLSGAAVATGTFILLGNMPVWGVWVSASVIAFSMGFTAIPVLKLFIQCLEPRYLATGLATLFVVKDVGSSQVSTLGGWLLDHEASSVYVMMSAAAFAVAAGIIFFVSSKVSALDSQPVGPP